MDENSFLFFDNSTISNSAMVVGSSGTNSLMTFYYCSVKSSQFHVRMTNVAMRGVYSDDVFWSILDASFVELHISYWADSTVSVFSFQQQAIVRLTNNHARQSSLKCDGLPRCLITVDAESAGSFLSPNNYRDVHERLLYSHGF
jgi:hypothetical protein